MDLFSDERGTVNPLYIISQHDDVQLAYQYACSYESYNL